MVGVGVSERKKTYRESKSAGAREAGKGKPQTEIERRITQGGSSSKGNVDRTPGARELRIRRGGGGVGGEIFDISRPGKGR